MNSPEVRQIAAGPSESFAVAFMTSFIFNWLQPFLEDSWLVVNLLLTLAEIFCNSRDGAQFTTQATEMDQHAPGKLEHQSLVNPSTRGHRISFGEFGATVVRAPSDRPGQ
jgi:hypothetical protein